MFNHRNVSHFVPPSSAAVSGLAARWAVVLIATALGCGTTPAVGDAASDSVADVVSDNPNDVTLPDAPADSGALDASSGIDVTDVTAVDTPADSQTSADTMGCPYDAGAPSARFAALHAALLRPGCVGAGRFCHEGGHEGFGMLTPAIAIANLVNVRGCVDIRVVPCRPDVSYVSWVIRNGGEPCGRPFPTISGGRHPTFSAADVALIEDWIRAGAQ